MSPPHLSGRVPDRVLRYLHPNEELRYLSRPHLAELRWQLVIGTSAVAFFVGAVGLHVPLIGALVLLSATIFVAVKGTPWWETSYAITDKRVLILTGVVADRLVDVPIKLVIDIKYDRTLLGRLLGYGDFELNLSGRPSLRGLVWVPEPDLVYWLLTLARVGDDAPRPQIFGEAARNLVAARAGLQQSIAHCTGCPVPPCPCAAEG